MSAPTSLITPALLAHMDALPVADGSLLDAETRSELIPYAEEIFMSLADAGLSGIALSMLFDSEGRPLTPDHTALLLRAFAQHGIAPPTGATNADLRAMMDAIAEVPRSGTAYDSRIAYGIALALRANRPDVALAIADGPVRAGAWLITRQDLEGAPVA